MIRARERTAITMRPLVMTVLAGAPAAAACVGRLNGAETASGGAFEPSIEEVPCPPNVANEIDYLDGGKATGATCGYLSVLEDRTKPDGRTIKLFLVRVPPPEGEPAPDPMFAYPDDDLVRNRGFNGGPSPNVRSARSSS